MTGARDPRLDAYIGRAAPFARRIATSIEWLAAGKPHNWKYR